MNQKTNKIIVLVGVMGIVIFLFLFLKNYKSQKEILKVSILENFLKKTSEKSLVEYSGLLPKGEDKFSQGKGTVSIYQVKLMKTVSGNEFLVPFNASKEPIYVDIRGQLPQLNKFAGYDYTEIFEKAKIKAFPFLPLKIDLPAVINLDYSKDINLLEKLDDGTHLGIKKEVSQIGEKYILCLESSLPFKEAKILTGDTIKFIDKQVVCSTMLNKNESAVLSFVSLFGADSVDKLLAFKTYYIPEEFIDKLNNQDDLLSLEKRGIAKILSIDIAPYILIQ